MLIPAVPFDEFSKQLGFFVSEKNIKLSLSFALSIINMPQSYWDNVLFADGSKFNIFWLRWLYGEEKIENLISRT
jgi:hypothetical protein